MSRVVLIDDQSMIRAGLRGILEDAGLVIAGEAADGREGIAVLRRVRPDAVLIDLRMPVLDGVSTVRQIRSDPDLTGVRILVLTTFDGDQDVVDALSAGADGFLSKAADPDELAAAVLAVVDGKPSLSSGATRAVLRHLGQRRTPPIDPDLARRTHTLTARERDVVAAAADGSDNAQIARDLFISPHTVKTHLNRAMSKLGARDRGQLVAYAFRAGLTRGP
jgi:DNA-binding NarL/FixJ family response regulator